MTDPTYRRVLRWESAMWGGLFRWIARRPAVPAGATGFGYARAKTPVLVTFIALCALETVAFHLLLPWPAVRIPVDVISVYGVIWMLGVLAGTWVRPHLVGRDGMRIRDGLVLDIAIPWDAVRSARRQTRTLPGGRGVQIDRSGDRAVASTSGRRAASNASAGRTVASIAVLSQTTVDIVLRRPVAVPVRGGGTELVDEIRFHADDPGALVVAARGHLPAAEPA
jgi:hypothetical protein